MFARYQFDRSFLVGLHQDRLFRASDGREIPLTVAGPPSHGVATEQASLERGAYWWLRLTGDVPTTLELLDVPNRRNEAPVTVTFDLRGKNLRDVLRECHDHAKVPPKLLQILEVPAA